MSIIATEAMQKLMRPTIADVALPEPYPLTKYQFDAITNAIESGTICFAHIDGLPSDSLIDQDKRATERKELNELEDLGILNDVSHLYKEAIQTSKLNNNERGFKVFVLTDTALAMFNGDTKGIN